VGLGQFERRLGRGDVDDHDLVELVGLAEPAQVVLDAFDGLPRGVHALGVRQVGQPGDGRPGVQHGAGADVRRPGVELLGAGGEEVGGEDVGPAVQLAGRAQEVAAADLVAAEDERGRGVEIDAGEVGQFGHEGSGVGPPAGQGREPEGRRRADAAERADQPKADPARRLTRGMTGLGHGGSLAGGGAGTGCYRTCGPTR
jgi:hypothetical protein